MGEAIFSLLSVWAGNNAMSEDLEKHILRKYEIAQKLGKGVRLLGSAVM